MRCIKTTLFPILVFQNDLQCPVMLIQAQQEFHTEKQLIVQKHDEENRRAAIQYETLSQHFERLKVNANSTSQLRSTDPY